MISAENILGAICSVVSGCYAFTRSLKDFQGLYKWRAYAKLALSTGLVYAGYVAALGTATWVLGTGAAPALLPTCALVIRCFAQRRRLNKLGQRYADRCPLSTLTEDTTFEQALSVSH
ncbi:hypothetical protein PSACC_01487 [Paramicrosporidium saccamoebae]|uniref:Uncharacterized protein n=1 Tax=Paramicrosporidium saccamoebae TaxID=1246581 RepID=A0A2H9TLU8_9FUNG|nr:hypothetical protein PSACC_01487 [Paramicrosporidium saccamoebae]